MSNKTETYAEKFDRLNKEVNKSLRFKDPAFTLPREQSIEDDFVMITKEVYAELKMLREEKHGHEYIDDFIPIVIDFRKQAISLFKSLNSIEEDLHHAATGIAGEAGEILELTKKHWIYNKPLNRECVIEELGDLAFYAINLMHLLNITPAEILKYNIRKLQKRYPEGYTDQAAQERADKKEN